MKKIRNSKTPAISDVSLAIAALDGNPNPMDMDMSDLDPDPTSLDLPYDDSQEACSRCGRPAVDACPQCGSPLCEECLSQA
jgi:hypothetical protein